MASANNFRKTNFSEAQCALELDLFAEKRWGRSKFGRMGETGPYLMRNENMEKTGLLGYFRIKQGEIIERYNLLYEIEI